MKSSWKIWVVLPLLAAWVVLATPAQAAAAAGDRTTSVFRVEGMTCGGCEAGVKLKLRRLDGVEEAEASYEKSRARVTYDPAEVTVERIIEAIEELGYEAECLDEPGSTCGPGAAR